MEVEEKSSDGDATAQWVVEGDADLPSMDVLLDAAKCMRASSRRPDRCGRLRLHSMSDVCADRYRKRVPLRPPTRPNDLYVTRSRQPVVWYKRAVELLFAEHARFTDVTVHALGTAVQPPAAYQPL